MIAALYIALTNIGLAVVVGGALIIACPRWDRSEGGDR